MTGILVGSTLRRQQGVCRCSSPNSSKNRHAEEPGRRELLEQVQQCHDAAAVGVVLQ